MNRIILLVWLCLAALCTFLTSCGEASGSRVRQVRSRPGTRKCIVQYEATGYKFVTYMDTIYHNGDTVFLSTDLKVIVIR